MGQKDPLLMSDVKTRDTRQTPGVRWEQGFERLQERAVLCKDNPLLSHSIHGWGGDLQKKSSWYSGEQVKLKEKELQMPFVSESLQVQGGGVQWSSPVTVTMTVTTNAKRCFRCMVATQHVFVERRSGTVNAAVKMSTLIYAGWFPFLCCDNGLWEKRTKGEVLF